MGLSGALVRLSLRNDHRSTAAFGLPYQGLCATASVGFGCPRQTERRCRRRLCRSWPGPSGRGGSATCAGVGGRGRRGRVEPARTAPRENAERRTCGLIEAPEPQPELTGHRQAVSSPVQPLPTDLCATTHTPRPANPRPNFPILKPLAPIPFPTPPIPHSYPRGLRSHVLRNLPRNDAGYLFGYFHSYFFRYLARNDQSCLSGSLPSSELGSVPRSLPSRSPHSRPSSFPNPSADNPATNLPRFLRSNEEGSGVRRSEEGGEDASAHCPTGAAEARSE